MESERGVATGFGLVALAVSLAIVVVLFLIGFNAVGGGATGGVTGGTGGTSSAPASIISRSPAETQLKLCAEGRDSSYGNPPSPAQQSKCLTELAGQLSG